VGTSERERPGAELGSEHTSQVARGVSEAARQTGDAFALDHSVADQSHCTRCKIVAEIPIGRPGHRIRLASLTGTQARLVGGRSGSVERYIAGMRRHRRAAGSAVDASTVHAGDELTIEPRVSG